MKPAPRHRDFPIGRVCMICGRGGTPRLGAVFGFAPALLALGYQWDKTQTLGMAHAPCVERARVKLKARRI